MPRPAKPQPYTASLRRYPAAALAGLTNPAGGVFDDIGFTVRRRHYRLLVGAVR